MLLVAATDEVTVVDADAAEAEESNDGGNAAEAIVVVVVVVAATIFDEEALRTQLSKLDTKVSSAEPTPQLVVEGDAALYSVAEVICRPISMGSGDTEADDAEGGNGLPAMLAIAEELVVGAVEFSCCCCCCWRNLRAGGRDTTTRYRVRPARSDSSLTAILSVSSGRSRLNMHCRCCWMSLPPEAVDVEDEAVEEPEIESRSSALSERERSEDLAGWGVVEEGGGAGSRGAAAAAAEEDVDDGMAPVAVPPP